MLFYNIRVIITSLHIDRSLITHHNYWMDKYFDKVISSSESDIFFDWNDTALFSIICDIFFRSEFSIQLSFQGCTILNTALAKAGMLESSHISTKSFSWGHTLSFENERQVYILWKSLDLLTWIHNSPTLLRETRKICFV